MVPGFWRSDGHTAMEANLLQIPSSENHNDRIMSSIWVLNQWSMILSQQNKLQQYAHDACCPQYDSSHQNFHKSYVLRSFFALLFQHRTSPFPRWWRRLITMIIVTQVPPPTLPSPNTTLPPTTATFTHHRLPPWPKITTSSARRSYHADMVFNLL